MAESPIVTEMRRLRARPDNCAEENSLIDAAIAAQLKAEAKQRADAEAKAALKIGVGWTGSVPCKKWSHHDRGHRWWITVVDVSACGRFAKVRGWRGFGKARWVETKSIKDPKPPVERAP